MKVSHTINECVFDTILSFELKKLYEDKDAPNALEISVCQRVDTTFQSKIILNTVKTEDLIQIAEKLNQLAYRFEEKLK